MDLKQFKTYEDLPDCPEQLKQIILLFMIKTKVLEEQVSTLTRAKFGQKSEQTKPTEPTVEKQPRKPRNHNKDNYQHKGRNPFPEHLPIDVIEYDLNPEEKHCACCQGFLTKIGKEVTKQLDLVPQTIIVREHTKLKYACRKCGRTVKLASMPWQPIEKGAVGPALLAYIIVSKYQDGLPLYRIQRQLKRYGVELSRATLWGWVRQSANLLEVLCEKIKEEVVAGKIAFSDDTHLLMLEPRAGKAKTSTMWAHGRKAIEEKGALTVYEFTSGRHGKNPQEFFKDFRGIIQADLYQGYGKLFTRDENGNAKRKLAACWAHVRRKFVDVVRNDPTSIAQEMVTMINALYAIEKAARKEGITGEALRLERLEKSAPILMNIYAWLKEYQQETPPTMALGKAINYALKAWQALQTFLDNGYIEIDNNRAERAIKTVVIGRKNFLFVGSENGGKTAAILFSLVETCKQNDIDSLAYLTDVLKRLPNHPYQRVSELLPHHWKPPQKTVAAA